jgi:copper chaperone
MTQSYRVTGMTCGGCVRAVTRAIVRRAPAATVTVDLPAGRVTIGGDLPPEAVVAEAVTDAGFAFAGVAEAAA